MAIRKTTGIEIPKSEEKGGTAPSAQAQNVVLTQEVLLEMIKAAGKGNKDDMAKMIQGLATAINPDAPREVNYNEQEIDKDDYMESPILFYTHISRYVIVAEKRYGRSVLPPLGNIKFDLHAKMMTGEGRDKKQRFISMYPCYLKTIYKFLKSSPQLGIMFHESINGVMSMDVHQSQRLLNAMNTLSGMNEQQVRNRASQEGIPDSFVDDYEAIRHKTIERIASKTSLSVHHVSAVSQNHLGDKDYYLKEHYAGTQVK